MPHPHQVATSSWGRWSISATCSLPLHLYLLLLLTLPAHAASTPNRIVSLSPNLTEILYGIGAFQNVAGVSDYCTYPAEVTKLPSVGGWRNPNLEKLAGLHPDLVIIDAAQAPFLEDKFHQLGLKVVVAADRSIAQIYESIATLGRATGHEAEAAKLTAATREGLDRVSRRTANLPKTRVVLIVDRTPGTLRDLYTATDGSFLAELVEIAGGKIAAPAAKTGYSKLNKEDLLALNPDAILDFIHGIKGRFSGDPMEAWRDIPELKAVRAHRVYGVNEDYVPHSSQRIVQTAELFARLLHPESK
jgi:iron complex transport system substrate-binding protein